MADYPIEVKGLDYSQPMLDIAASKAAQKGKTLTFTQGDASRLPSLRVTSIASVSLLLFAT